MLWLIVTEEKIMGISSNPDTYYEHTLTGAEIDNLRIINPSKLHELLTSWHTHAPLKHIALAFIGSPIYEQYNSAKVPAGFISETCVLNQKTTYTAGIPYGIFIQYHCVMQALGITLQTITTLTLVLHAAQHGVLSKEALITGCKKLNESF